MSGWASLILATVAFGSMILVCLGIMGEYIGRIYEQTPVTKVHAGSPCRVITRDDAEVTAPWVVLATHIPILVDRTAGPLRLQTRGRSTR